MRVRPLWCKMENEAKSTMKPRDPLQRMHEVSYLYITDGELYHWLGPEAASAMATTRGWETRVFLGTMATLAVLMVGSTMTAVAFLAPEWVTGTLLFVLWMLLLLAAVPLTICLAVGWLINCALLRWWPAAALTRRQPKQKLALARALIGKARQYNDLIRQIELVHKLRDLGHDVACDLDAEVLAGLRSVREELRRAMQTDRLLRTHPVKSPIVDLDFSLAGSPEVLETKMAAREHSLLLRQALEIGTQVREDMERLVRSASTVVAPDLGYYGDAEARPLPSQPNAGANAPGHAAPRQSPPEMGPGGQRSASAPSTTSGTAQSDMPPRTGVTS
ncbi:hypothetical protein DB346_24210 [Verrucomicrobia bacterium LW23]|nr:hypothetical protein DB346_24210 [Verrucomicrobia bacterium LW23]